jgi:hypothetical protein
MEARVKELEARVEKLERANLILIGHIENQMIFNNSTTIALTQHTKALETTTSILGKLAGVS